MNMSILKNILIKKTKKERKEQDMKTQKYLILQMGEKRSIIKDTQAKEDQVMIVDNSYLLYLDELNKIIF